jgi:hypothetical protein
MENDLDLRAQTHTWIIANPGIHAEFSTLFGYDPLLPKNPEENEPKPLDPDEYYAILSKLDKSTTPSHIKESLFDGSTLRPLRAGVLHDLSQRGIHYLLMKGCYSAGDLITLQGDQIIEET